MCQTCRARPERTCAICGRKGRGNLSRAINKHVCDRCKGHWVVCSGCGTGAVVRGGTPDKPLCARCVNPDPTFWKRCRICEITWQLTTAPCTRCCLDRRLREVFTAADGTTAPELDRLREKLIRVDHPNYAITWLRKANVQETIRAVVREHPVITHNALDAMPRSKTLDHFRSMLVHAGALEPRDERLVRLEQRVHGIIDQYDKGDHRQALHGYAVWHLLRRLRTRLKGTFVTDQQAINLRLHVTAADAFLRWLEARGQTLATCTQPQVEAWAATKPSYVEEASGFIRWAVAHRYAHGLSAPALRWTGPAGPHDQDRRWADARRLLHDDTLAIADRVAGLLILLYAQKVSSICQLTTDHVSRDDGPIRLHLGSRPITLPEPVDALVEELVATRRADTLLSSHSTWLFPGRQAGQPLHESQMIRRLRAVGVKPRQSRNTALFTLASQIPAAILAKVLGLHRSVAVQWQQASGGDWMAYAADVATRNSRTVGDAQEASVEETPSTTSQV
ncbi:hypothetical protein [Streptomyces litchfieldiae]|uniref:Integrase n=1 Tax=Streptomyces litchfieldiae TaxID=3075543 RepID=A0ABU2N0W1_9ACTN|nr:hypothetical protein [Streptomyces sp. DSM 44938]MDT0347520.1 hypothetical protein [Streptomyces sp. DSM 44938]